MLESADLSPKALNHLLLIHLAIRIHASSMPTEKRCRVSWHVLRSDRLSANSFIGEKKDSLVPRSRLIRQW